VFLNFTNYYLIIFLRTNFWNLNNQSMITYYINLSLILFNNFGQKYIMSWEENKWKKEFRSTSAYNPRFSLRNDETISLSTLVILSYSLIVINRYAGKIDDSRIQASFVCRDYNDSRYKATLGRSDPLRKMMFVPVWLLVELVYTLIPR